jgi:nucleotide-binding universal stress UspA family protein
MWLTIESDAAPLVLGTSCDRRVCGRRNRDRDHQAGLISAAVTTTIEAVFASIVVGTDGSDTARTALQQAIALARQADARLQIVSAYEPVSDQRLQNQQIEVPKDLEWMVNPRGDVLQTLDAARDEAARAGVEKVETFARQGDAADAILDIAEEQRADLIVVGNKGMTGAKRFLLGSVPNKVSHHAPCSVLIVRTT